MSDLLSGEQPLVPPTDAHVIALDRWLDLEAVTRIERSAAAACPARTLIDLSMVSMVGSAELAALCCSLRRLLAGGAVVVLVDADARTRWVLELVGLERVECVESVREGLAASDGRRSVREAIRRWPSLRRRTTSYARAA